MTDETVPVPAPISEAPLYTMRDASDEFKNGFKLEEATPAKDEWFSASIESNGLWPQRALGIALFMADALVHESADVVVSYRKSSYTQEQIDSLRKMMTNMHRTRGITATGEGLQQPDTKIIISDLALRELWHSEVLLSINTVTHIGNIVTEGKYFPDGYNSYTTEQLPQKMDFLYKLLSDPELGDAKDKITAFLDTAVEEMRSDEGKELAREHKSRFKRVNGIQPPQVGVNTPMDRMGAILIDSINERTGIPKAKIVEVFNETCLENFPKPPVTSSEQP